MWGRGELELFLVRGTGALLAPLLELCFLWVGVNRKLQLQGKISVVSLRVWGAIRLIQDTFN